jgi:hypothetical protein
MKCIVYREGYNYRLHEPYRLQTNIRTDAIYSEHVNLVDGLLVIQVLYHWDGASGPAKDTDNNMRASLVHDALYGLLREGLLDMKFRKEADQLFRDIYLEDSHGWKKWLGFSWIRSRYSYLAVRWRGDEALEAPHKPVKIAPKGCREGA